MQTYFMLFFWLVMILTVFIFIPIAIYWIVHFLIKIFSMENALSDFQKLLINLISVPLMLSWVFCVLFVALMSMPIPGKNPPFEARYMTEGVYPALGLTGGWFIAFLLTIGVCALYKKSLK